MSDRIKSIGQEAGYQFRFAELMPSVIRRMRPFSLEWPYEALTQTQTRTLMLLSEGPESMTKIASALDVGLPSATRIVNALVKKGLVVRSADDGDRRRVLCSLAEGGQMALARVDETLRIRAEKAAVSQPKLSDYFR